MSTPHITTLALRGHMPKGACKTCDRGAIKRRVLDCRGNEPLNGEDAAHEFARHLLPAVRAVLLDPKPAPKPPVRWALKVFVNGTEVPGVVAEEPRDKPEPDTSCPRCHEDAGYTKNRCSHCGMKRGRRVSRTRHYAANLEAA